MRMAALGYDMTRHARRRDQAGAARPNRRSSATRIAATKDFDGVTGKITIDAKRNAQKDAVVLKIEDGRFKFYRSVPAT